MARVGVCLATAAVSALFLAATAFAAGPTNTDPPTISGSFVVGGTLTASTGTWLGSDPVSFAYQWQNCASYTGTVESDSPVGYWRLGEASGSSTTADTSGNGHRSSPRRCL
jgi:hypothetical protein